MSIAAFEVAGICYKTYFSKQDFSPVYVYHKANKH